MWESVDIRGARGVSRMAASNIALLKRPETKKAAMMYKAWMEVWMVVFLIMEMVRYVNSDHRAASESRQ